MGDGLAQIVAAFVGGPPVTSYGENIGVLAITRVHSVFVIGGAAVFAVILGFVGKLSALILSIPGPVISGISFILFGVIAASRMKILIENKVDFDKRKSIDCLSDLGCRYRRLSLRGWHVHFISNGFSNCTWYHLKSYLTRNFT